MNHKATVWLTACVSLLPAPFLAFTTRSHNLFHSKLTALLDERHRSTLHGRNLHEAKLASLLQDVRNSSLAPVLHGTPITARRTKFPPWHFMHPYSNETFEGQTVDYNFWKQPPPSSQEIIDEFRKYYPREKRPRYTGRYNFTEIGSIFEQAFIDGELKSGDYDYIRDLLKKNLTGKLPIVFYISTWFEKTTSAKTCDPKKKTL